MQVKPDQGWAHPDSPFATGASPQVDIRAARAAEKTFTPDTKATERAIFGKPRKPVGVIAIYSAAALALTTLAVGPAMQTFFAPSTAPKCEGERTDATSRAIVADLRKLKILKSECTPK